MDYLQAAVKIAREQEGTADTTTAHDATTAAAASASASAAAASALTAVEVIAEFDMDGKPPTMKRRRTRIRKTEDQCIPLKISFQQHIDKLKKEGKYRQRLEKKRTAAAKSNVANKANLSH